MAIGAGAFLYRRQRRTLRQYEILFGREALLQASNAQPMAGGLSGRDAENYRNHEQFEMQGVSPSSESRANPMSSVLASQIELDVVDDRDK